MHLTADQDFDLNGGVGGCIRFLSVTGLPTSELEKAENTFLAFKRGVSPQFAVLW